MVEIAIDDSQGLFVGHHSNRAVMATPQRVQKAQNPCPVVEQGFTVGRSAPDGIFGYRGLILLHRPVFKTRQNIIDFCKANLARFKAPKAVEFSELPKTATGKIKRFMLKEENSRVAA